MYFYLHCIENQLFVLFVQWKWRISLPLFVFVFCIIFFYMLPHENALPAKCPFTYIYYMYSNIYLLILRVLVMPHALPANSFFIITIYYSLPFFFRVLFAHLDRLGAIHIHFTFWAMYVFGGRLDVSN